MLVIVSRFLHILPHTGWGVVVLLVDLTLVYTLTYYALAWIKQTHSAALIRGLLGIFFGYAVSWFLGFATLNWVLEKIATALILIAIIIFQPELRRFLERLGTGGIFKNTLFQRDTHTTSVIKQLLKGIDFLCKEKIGALIVIEVGSNLSEYIESGIPLKSTISAELIGALFWPNTPTHDGAVVIRNNQIEAAGCLLPLRDAPLQDLRLGMRHRAALGLSQVTDALIIVVSEESGILSLVENGTMTRFLNREALETRLFSLYKEEERHPSSRKKGLA